MIRDYVIYVLVAAVGLVAGCAGQPARTSFGAVPPERAEILPVPNKVTIRGALADAKYEQLDLLLERFRLASLWDVVRGEDPLIQAYKAFEIADEAVLARIDRWIKARPDSYQAHTARAYCAFELGADARGGKWAKDTKPAQFALMGRYYAVAEKEAKTALQMQPQSVAPFRVLVRIAKYEGNQFPGFVSAALAAFPASYNLRVNVLTALQPRWLGGAGNYTWMEQFAQASQQYAGVNPKLAQLLGYPYWARGQDLATDERYVEAIEMYSKALQFGEEIDFLLARSDAARRLRNYELALKDAARIEELQPWRVHDPYAEVLPDVEGSAENWAYKLLNEGHANEGLELLAALVRIAPGDKWTHYTHGRALCAAHRVDAAVAELEAALRLDADYKEAIHDLWSCLATRSLGEAIRRQEAYVLTAPGNGVARYELAKLYERVKDMASAASAYGVACQLDYGDACSHRTEIEQQHPEVGPLTALHAQERLASTKEYEEFMADLAASPEYSGSGAKPLERPPPPYPRWALLDPRPGVVEMMLFFKADGTVAGAQVTKAEPPGYFELAAVSTALRWRAEAAKSGWKAIQRFHFSAPPEKKVEAERRQKQTRRGRGTLQ